jgi:iron complex outermembrane receptor protein
MFKQVLITLLFTTFVLAEKPISGQVFSTNGNSLSYAVISDASGQNWVISDENGYFNYNSGAQIGLGDSLNVSRYGYKTNTFQLSELSFYVIELSLQPIEHISVIVKGSNYIANKQLSNTYSKILENNEPINLFQQIPGIAIRSYGGKTGGMFLSTYGAPAVNTKILLGDVDLTNAQFGSIDLSLIPEALINNLSLVNSPGIFYGSGAIDGAININPRQNSTYLSARLGSYGHNGLLGNYFKNYNKASINLSAGYLKDDGNYNYYVDNDQFTRENNDFERKYYSLNGIMKISNKSNINGLFLESRQKRGIAGSIAWPSPLARRQNKLQIGNISYNNLNKNGYTKIQLSTRISTENYDDPNPFWPLSSEHVVYGNSVKISHNHTLWSNISTNFLIEGKQDKIKSTDVGDHERFMQSFATEVSIPVLNKFRVSPAFRFDRTGSSDIHNNQSMRIAYNGLKDSKIEYIIRTGFRNPTFNDLYWNPGGNPDLKPEKSWDHSLKYKHYLNNEPTNNIYLNISDNHAIDLIQWAPTDETFMVWQPQNIAKSRRTNITFGNQVTPKQLPLQLAWHATYQKTEDLDLNKQLLFAPNFIGFIGFNYTIQGFSIGIQGHYTGERLAQYGFDDDTNLPGYLYISAVLKYQKLMFGNSWQFILDASNLLDKQYMVTNDYPEPGRMIIFCIKYVLSE